MFHKWTANQRTICIIRPDLNYQAAMDIITDAIRVVSRLLARWDVAPLPTNMNSPSLHGNQLENIILIDIVIKDHDKNGKRSTFYSNLTK